MSFAIQHSKKKGVKPSLPLVLINSVPFLSNILDNLVKTLGENDFYHLSQKFNAIVLSLLEKKIFLYDYLDNFKKIKRGLPSKDEFHNTLTNHAINVKNYEHILILTLGKPLK